MASSSSSSSTMISLLVLTFLLTLINPTSSSPLLDDICKHTKIPDFCYNIFIDHQSDNAQELAQSVIEQTTTIATRQSNKFQILLSQTKDQKTKAVYSLCKNYYTAALSSLAAAIQDLKSADFRDVKAEADAVSRDVASCRKAYATVPSQPEEDVVDVAGLELYCDVFVVTSGNFS